MRTTLTIDDDVAVRLDEFRKKNRVSFKVAVNLLLRNGLMADEQPRKIVSFNVRARSLGKVREGFNLDKISQVLDRLDESEGR